MQNNGLLTIALDRTFDGPSHGAPIGSPDGDWMLVFPAGVNSTRSGRGPFKSGDLAAMQEVIKRTLARAGNTEIMVDYDHHLADLDQGKTGATAKAAGWIKEWAARTDGIWARVDWTEEARRAIKAGEYRYLSPYFDHDSSNQLQRFRNIALVNTPDLDLVAVAARDNSNNPGKETSMDFMAKLRKALKLDDDASEEVILAAVGKLGTAKASDAGDTEKSVAEALKPVALAAGLKEDADGDAIVEGIKALATKAVAAGDETAVVTALREELTEMGEKLNAVTTSTSRDRATTFVDNSIREGRVGVKKLRDHYIEKHMEDPERVEKEINSFLIVEEGSSVLSMPPDQAGTGAVALSASERETARAFGWTDEEYAEAKKADVEKGGSA